MKFTHFFIERPIFAAVLSFVIVLVGGLTYFTLPVSQYPNVAPPTVLVRASYPGATPQVIADTVATPIEQEMNGVDDMLYMESSSSSDGTMQLTVTFKLGTDLDDAQVLVQNRVAIAESRLPEQVRQIGVTTTKQIPDMLMVVHLSSPDGSRDNLYINFDPANMILYGTGEPIEALRKVGQHVRSIHCKDATWAAADRRGQDWGAEVALGDGDVGMETYLRTLQEIGYDGPLTIEREIPEDPVQQKADIGKAVSLLESLRTQILS